MITLEEKIFIKNYIKKHANINCELLVKQAAQKKIENLFKKAENDKSELIGLGLAGGTGLASYKALNKTKKIIKNKINKRYISKRLKSYMPPRMSKMERLNEGYEVAKRLKKMRMDKIKGLGIDSFKVPELLKRFYKIKL